jgi:hypothetical protein
MPSLLPINAPGGFVPLGAIAYGDGSGMVVPVDAAHPLPTFATFAPATAVPLAGTTAASIVAGPFTPVLGRAIWISLGGTWAGTVTVVRSTDGGATRQPLTVAGQSWASFAGNANEPIGDETVAGATYYLQITINSGSLTYQVAQ